MSKVECFYWNKLSSKSFFFESEQFFYLCFALAVQGGCTDAFLVNEPSWK